MVEMNRVLALFDFRHLLHKGQQPLRTDRALADRRGEAGQLNHRPEEHLHVGVEGDQFAERHPPLRHHVTAETEHGDRGVDRNLVHHDVEREAAHRQLERHVEGGLEPLHEVAVLGFLHAERLHHLNAVDHLGEVGGDFGHMFAQHHRPLPQNLAEPRKHQINHRQHHEADERQRRTQHHQHDADEDQREEVRRDSDDHRRKHRLERGDVGQDVRNQLAGPVLLVEAQRQALEVAEELHPQIEQHPVDRIVREIVAAVEEKRPHPVEQDHPAEEHVEQTQVRPAERLIDDDFEHKRHQETEAGADHMEDDGDSEQRAVRFYEAVKLLELMRFFGSHNPASRESFPCSKLGPVCI